jgi:hypothetical protein
VLEGAPHELLAIAEISHRGYVARGVRSREDKYIERFSPEEGELYFDLTRDPRELTSLLGERPDRVRTLRDALNRVMAGSPFQNHVRTQGTGEFHLLLRTSGWFQDEEMLGDSSLLQREADGRKLRLTLRSKPDHPQEAVFSVRPTGAPVFLEGTWDGKSLKTTDIHMGEAGLAPGGVPAQLPEVEGKETETHPDNNVLAPPRTTKPGVELWLTTASKIIGPNGPPCETLVALGYLSGPCPKN